MFILIDIYYIIIKRIVECLNMCKVDSNEVAETIHLVNNKIKALALIQKYLGLDKQVVEQKTEETINITLED